MVLWPAAVPSFFRNDMKMGGAHVSRIRLFGAVVPVVLLTIALGACRAEEQGRITAYEPGVYQGKTEAALNESALDGLRARALHQAGDFSRTGGGGPKRSTTADVRPPAEDDAASVLRSRLSKQMN